MVQFNITFCLIAYYSFTDLKHIKWVKIIIPAYERFSLFSLAFAIVCLFFREFQSYGGAWHRATLGSVNLFKIIQGISQVWENSQTLKSLLISYHITISWLYPLNGFRIIILLLQDCVTAQSKSCFAGVDSYVSFFHLKCTIMR